jgi:isopentenyldiphosphate isomerase
MVALSTSASLTKNEEIHINRMLLPSSMDELIDIVDKEGNPTGRQVMKSEAHRNGYLHPSVHIWVYSGNLAINTSVLFQKRAKDKDVYPDVWDVSAAGHVGAGESPLPAAIREISEELGILADGHRLTYIGKKTQVQHFHNITNREVIHAYLFRYGGEKIIIQEEEVQEARFFTLEQLATAHLATPEDFIDNKPYWTEIKERVLYETTRWLRDKLFIP